MRIVLSSRFPLSWFAAPGIMLAQPDFYRSAQRLVAKPAFRRAVSLMWCSFAILLLGLCAGASVTSTLILLAFALGQAFFLRQIASRTLGADE